MQNKLSMNIKIRVKLRFALQRRRTLGAII